MMLADYSSYLEFIGAVYFTMSLDEVLTKKIWSPQNLQNEKRALDEIDVGTDDSLKKAILDANKQKGACLQAELSKKSVFGLFLIAGLLVFCGYEQHLQGNENGIIFHHLCIVYTLIIYMVSMMFGLVWIVFRKWKYTSLYIIAIFTLYSVFVLNHWVYGKTSIEVFVDKNFGLLVCGVVSLPIFKQIVLTWLYKSVFYGYIKEKIKEANKRHDKALECINKGNVDQLAKEYHDIYMQKSVSSPNSTTRQVLDDSLTEYKGVLYNDIRMIGINVRMMNLLGAWLIHTLKRFYNIIVNVFKSKNIKESLIGIDFETHAKRFQQIKKGNPKYKMSDYCVHANIDLNEFNKFYTKYLKR